MTVDIRLVSALKLLSRPGQRVMIVGDLIIDVGPGLQKLFPCLSRSYESVITCHEISSSANHVSLGPLSLHPALLHFVDDHCLASTCHAM